MSASPSNSMNNLDRMLHPDEAREIVLAHTPLLEAELVSIGEAHLRVLANDLYAAEDHPAFAASTMDGYAVVAADFSPWREVLGVQTAGERLDLEVSEGYTVKIMTGAPLPAGADAVIKVENTELAEDHVVVHQDVVTTGENIRQIGSDLSKDSLVLRAGTVLGPAEIGLLAGLGITPVEVRRRPRVSVLSTGDELVEPGEPIKPGQIRDSNRFSLVAALEAESAEVVWSGHAPDNRAGLEALLRQLIEKSDVVITSGGVSMGDLDLIKAILGEIATVHFRRVFVKPGKPLNFATAGNTMIFGLPGNPVSAHVSFEVFVRTALGKMSGRRDIDRPTVTVTLGQSTPPTDRIEFQRAHVTADSEGRLIATTTGSQASSRLASFVGANALLVIPPRETSYAAGEQVKALMFGPPAAE